MSLYTYKKNQELKYKYSENIVLYNTDRQNSQFKFTNLFSNIYISFKNLVTKSKLASILIPGSLIFLGIFFIYQDFFPDIQQTLQINLGYLSKGNVSPVSDQYIDISQYISRPVDFPNLINSALKQTNVIDDQASRDYSGTFYISIPSLGINRLPVEGNVDSTTPDIYLKALTTKLAHFKGTCLPFSNNNCNTVVYGHSASPNYRPKVTDAEVAFSFLSNIQVGDDIFIYVNNQTFHYRMYKSKVVSPDDTSIITGIDGQKTLTLFTCAPAGSDLNRFVAIAKPVYD